MKSFRIVTSLAVVGVLTLGLSGCGDKAAGDAAAPVKNGVDQIHKADGAVDKLNDQTDQSEGVVKQFKK